MIERSANHRGKHRKDRGQTEHLGNQVDLGQKGAGDYCLEHQVTSLPVHFVDLPAPFSEWSSLHHLLRTQLPSCFWDEFDDTSATLFEALNLPVTICRSHWRNKSLLHLNPRGLPPRRAQEIETVVLVHSVTELQDAFSNLVLKSS